MIPAPFEQNTIKINHIVNAIRTEMALFGYQSVETPIIEPADLFLTRAGDQVITQLFTFERYGRQLALRPEFTAAAAHYYTQLSTSQVVRWQFSGPIFEDDPNNIEPHYQRLSMGAELVGLAGAAADSEILGLAARGITRLNMPDYQLVIGNTGLLRHVLSKFGLDKRTERMLLNLIGALHDPSMGKAYVMEQFDRLLVGTQDTSDHDGFAGDQPVNGSEINTQPMLDTLLDATQRGMTMGGRTRQDIARRLLQKRLRHTERHQVVAALNMLDQWAPISAVPEDAFRAIDALLQDDDEVARNLLSEWQNAVELLDVYGIDSAAVVIQPHVTRNWDYYTGIVFELRSQQGIPIAGGGRYDELIALVGGDFAVPAVGFAYYLDEIIAQAPFRLASERDAVTIIADLKNQNEVLQAAQFAQKLRKNHISAHILAEKPTVAHGPVVQVHAQGLRLETVDYGPQEVDELITIIKRVYDET